MTEDLIQAWKEHFQLMGYIVGGVRIVGNVVYFDIVPTGPVEFVRFETTLEK